MTVHAAKFVPLFSSEQTVPKPWIGCGVVADQHVTAEGTLGESQTKPNGRPYDRNDLTDQLKVGLRAFHRVSDSNGIPDRDDAQRIHRAMFPGLPDLIPLVSRDFDEVVEWLKADNAISIACFMAALPAGAALRRYTSAPHQIALVDRDGEVRRGKATTQDGMHAPQLSWKGHQVPLQQVEKAAKGFPGSDHGLVLAWRVPRGGWTQEALAVAAARDRIKALREDADTASSVIRKLSANVDRQQARIAELEAGGAVDCSDKIAAAVESERIAIRDLVDARRSL